MFEFQRKKNYSCESLQNSTYTRVYTVSWKSGFDLDIYIRDVMVS